MSEESQHRQVRFIEDPNRPGFPRIVTEGENVREVNVREAENWSDDDVRISLTDHDIRGSNTQVIRVSDAEAQELFGKLATYLLGKGLLGVVPPPEVENECGDYPAPCNHDPAHESPPTDTRRG